MILPSCIKDAYSSYHLYVIRLDLSMLSKTQKQIHDELIDCGIMVNLHYIPVYRQPFYKKFGFQQGYCEESEQYFKEALSIPIHPRLSYDDQSHVIESLRQVIT